MSALGLILGIISILLSFTFFTFIGPVLGSIAGVIGIILSASARKKEVDSIATVALITSIIGTVLNIILSLTCMACISGAKLVGDKVIKEMQKSDMDVNKIQDKIKKQFNDGYKKEFDDAFKEAKKKLEKKSVPDKKDSTDW
jgi:predicted RND superfamily exporter protein